MQDVELERGELFVSGADLGVAAGDHARGLLAARVTDGKLRFECILSLGQLVQLGFEQGRLTAPFLKRRLGRCELLLRIPDHFGEASLKCTML